MHIAELTAYRVVLPLRKRIAHASAARDSSENIVVRCALADGTEGWGEGVPREYVTGETPEGALRQLAATPLSEQLAADCLNWCDVIALCERFQPAQTVPDPRGCQGNALRCAVELSILDAFGRLFGEPLSRLVAHVPPAEAIRADLPQVRYSGAITAETRGRELVSALKMRLYGFAQCKIKVGVEGVDDMARLRRLRRVLGKKMDLRLDANEAWSAAHVVEHIEPLLAFGVSCIEQPVRHEEIAALAGLRRRLPVKVMLDESLTSLHDARQAIAGGTADLFNIRLSKCGGFVNSLRLAALAHQAGLGYQLGCHPGESGILSAAGRHWACSVAGIRYLEGSYDRHILAERLIREDITFGYGGFAPALPDAGLGVTVDSAAVERLSVQRRHFRL
jgi:L-alanine-DL-glutamate epimerase-like enolase superfamily enzyme